MTELSLAEPHALSCFGHCRDCGRRHGLPVGAAGARITKMMAQLQALGRLDDTVPPEAADPRLAFDALFDGTRGHMFGAMECLDGSGETVWLRAFSSLKGGIRQVHGWVPPILDATVYHQLLVPGEAELVRLTAQLDEMTPGTDAYKALFKHRRQRSQSIMRDMQAAYEFQSFRGETRSLHEAFLLEKAPGGVGECCAPKLLQWAILNRLEPVSIAEIYWGGTPPTGSKRAEVLYGCCETRCQPLVGFMLCGLERAMGDPLGGL